MHGNENFDSVTTAWKHIAEATWDAVRSGGFRKLPANIVVLDSTPTNLVSEGFPADLPWVHPRGYLIRECRSQPNRWDMENHGIPRDVLVRLPELLANPIACYVNDDGYSDRVNIVLDASSEHDVPLVASVAFGTYYADEMGHVHPCIRIMSIHARNYLPRNLSLSAEYGNIVSIEHVRLKRLFSRCGMFVPSRVKHCQANRDAFPTFALESSKGVNIDVADGENEHVKHIVSRSGAIELSIVV